MADPGSIQASINAIADFILKYAVTLAALAALTVGLLEAYKKIFSTLPRFQRQALRRWLTQEAPPPAAATQMDSVRQTQGHYGVAHGARATQTGRDEPYDSKKAYAEVVHLTTGVHIDLAGADAIGEGGFSRNVSFALFELELATMMAQIQEAADAALNNPTRYRNWFAFLTRGCDALDVATWVEGIRSTPAPGAEGPTAQQRREELAEVYARIRLLMRRQLDSFQTITAYRWREWNQLWAWVVGFVLLLLAQLLQAMEAAVVLSPSRLVMILIVSLAGGILAPIAKDLVSALAKVRSGV